MGADDYLDASHGLDFDHEGAHDADMIDDVAEPAMIDADDHYAEADYTVEMQDGAERTYEADMIEDDYDEDIDAPVTEIQEDPSEKVQHQEAEKPGSTEEHVVVETNNGEHAVELPTEQKIEPVKKYEHDTAQHTEQQLDLSEENVNQQAEVDTTISPHAANHPDDTVEGIVPLEAGEVEGNADESKQAQTQGGELGEAQTQGDDRAEPQASQEQEEAVEVEKEGEKEEEAEAEVEARGEAAEVSKEAATGVKEDAHTSDKNGAAHLAKPESSVAERSPLYPVKVYYQENEISLFPPREGDSSEMFFLEDESLAYGPFDKLFESCHEVLREHIGDGEVLIMDVEALNIQLAEDSLHTSKVTLSQIVDLYLRLCHNDGVNEPEALYLTLSTKLTASAELSDLLVAANEGKGLSEIHSSVGYVEGEDELANIQDGSYEEFNPDHTQQDSSEAEDNFDSEFDQVNENESTSKAEGAAEDQQDEQDREDQGQSASDNINAVEASSGNALEDGDAVDDNDHEVEPAEVQPTDSGDNELPNEESYDSEEQSESTATVTQLPETELADEEQVSDKPTDAIDGQVSHDPELEYHDPEAVDDEAYPEEETNVDATEHFDFGEAEGFDVHNNAEEASGDLYGDVTETTAEASHEKAFPEIEDEPKSQNATADADSNDHDNADGEALQGDGGDDAPYTTEAVPNGVSQDVPEIRTQPASDLENDSLGITEDPLKSLSKDSKHINDETNTDDDEEPGEIHENDEHAPLLDEANQEGEELTFDEEYLDLEFQGVGAADEEDFAKSPSRAPTKRHRELEDDFELTEIPTPDAKRSRSS
ncbi:hypothetical protein BO71DRAFT_414205 [Aspergillus ellipticus CBS 707.79]|uniref:Uncharacterized protein n=1 Tax=Aspergillus ellipticus CBS 707.79 TaxID=1448320 RepID=A0A319CSI2_9EURO|nr:hypothetical protein BO71DRAFT_414205 [Aspergillus ellipticus CBS 707.79]